MARDGGGAATRQLPSHSHEAPGPVRHRFQVAGPGAHAPRPTTPSQAVLVDVGERTGALVLHAVAEREGLEVEIHPVAAPTERTHVWVLPRAGRQATVYAAVFPSLAAGDYAVIAPDGSVATVVSVAANTVTDADWA